MKRQGKDQPSRSGGRVQASNTGKQPTVQNEKKKATSSGMGKSMKSKMDSIMKSELRTDKTNGKSMYESARGITMMSTMDRTRMWWTQKTPQRKRTLKIQTGVMLGCIVLLLLAIIAGGFFMLKRRNEGQKEMDQTQMKTRLELCRIKYQYSLTYTFLCIFENEESYNNCTPGDHCIVQEWKFTDESKGGRYLYKWKKLVTYLPLNETESVDCGVGKWCKEEQCNPMKGKWWNNRQYEPFDKEPEDEPRQKGTFECIQMTGLSKVRFDDYFLKPYKECNKTVCKNPGVKHGIQIEYVTCDKEPGYGHANGDRSRPCHPIKVYSCHTCENPAGKPPGCNQDCQCANETTAAEDGLDCTTNGKQGLCVAGFCYEYERWDS